MRPLRLLAALTGSPRLLGTAPRTGAGPVRVPQDSLSGAGGTAPAPDRPRTRARLRAWAELLRVSALFTVPGDALAGAAATGRRPGRGTALAVGASLCLYEAGMALNDWADREEDAVDRPHRPIPSGRVAPGAALAAAGALTAAGLALAARAGRPALAVASGLAATVWAYDLRLKHTRLGPAAMASARTLDLLLGATATSGTSAAASRPTGAHAASRPTGARTPAAALPAALALGAHTYAVTAVSRHEVQGGSTAAPLAALAGVTAIGTAVLRGRPAEGEPPPVPATGRLLLPAFAAAYLRTSGVPLLHAALNPSPPLTQRAVGGGIRAMIPLQAALAARAGAPLVGLAAMGLVPLARALSRKVSPT
ncbi:MULTISPECIES: SCO3242 family prenyltransferase [unclassified Streptomyces]|uniref:SCO3242 family prenyltransferase n=1 Tax=unclassified Streptomyces TaxID=2593676 RepID=UPI002E14387D|nr:MULTISPECIES: UbiA family prenyltransferase [unclassified Streptomyces]WSQ76403.1 UbiA family prenyltransferase [Streptomyces sp. NBC_01213]WSQ83650.1 UbiA family prenyltransferase [Streptomyces sp. NBC_01212]WSR10322.1 UbiA family prenyltransferase [Streptomyces sp. NBC_01208]WSR46979.1 UbiA family prenyltransferase [Streptomyces sp. NBC_01201]